MPTETIARLLATIRLTTYHLTADGRAARDGAR